MDTKAIFEHRVSRGSRFNQIYIPRGMEQIFEAGDIVEVRLVRKREKTYYSKNLEHIGEFKIGIVKHIFSILDELKEVRQIFIVGSFLTQKSDYNDIDIILISDKKGVDEKAYNLLSEKMPLKFHIIAIAEKTFENLLKICPLTRSMLYYFASNKKFELSEAAEIDKRHLEFLLMMPEDLLKLKISGGRIYYDALRRLIAIRKFFDKESLDSVQIDKELKLLLGEHFYAFLKKNEPLDKKSRDTIKKILKEHINRIQKQLK